MAFTGVVPEAANGRIAMLAFVAAAAAELNGAGARVGGRSATAPPPLAAFQRRVLTPSPARPHAGTVIEQASAYAGPIAAVAALLAVASIFPAMAGSRAQGVGPFTSDAETMNGRAAMVAFMLLLCLEKEYAGKFFG